MDEIRIDPYDPVWPERFAAERRFVEACLGVPPTAMEHIGSTAVPGLAAKPVIDILVVVRDLADAMRAVPALEAGGYSYWRDNPDTGRLFLVKGLPPAPQRTHHLHIHAGMDELRRHLAFRDALRGDDDLRDAYAELKRGLAARLGADREAYTEAKTAFIDEVVARAGGPARPRVAHKDETIIDPSPLQR